MADSFTLEELDSILTPTKMKGERKERVVLHTAPILRRFVASAEVYKVVNSTLYPQADNPEQIRKAFEYQINAVDTDVELDTEVPRIEGAQNVKAVVNDGNVWLINVPLFEAWKAEQSK